MRHRPAWMLMSLLVMASAGCRSTAIKQVYYTVKGAGGKFYEVKSVDPATLARYQSVSVEPFGNELGAVVPYEVVRAVHEQVPARLAESALFFPTGKQLRVVGKIIHYTGKSGLTGSVGSIIGGGEDCVCRVQLRDGQSGNLIGEAICWGVVKSALRRGAEELGKGVGKAVVKWIERRLPEEVRRARHEKLRPQ